MDALELLEQEYLKKRQKLERQLFVASLLPTNNKVINWIGENGWDAKGTSNPPIEKTSPILPWIFHDSTAYSAASHISYKAPDNMKWTNGQGESTSSSYRLQFVNQYVLSVVDSYRPYIIQTVAVKGSRYSGTFPTKFDFTKVREYEDAKEIGYGDCEIYVTTGFGESAFTSGTFSFHVSIENVGIVKIDIEVPGIARLAPIAHGVSRYGGNGPVSSVKNWTVPSTLRKPVHTAFYAGGDSRSKSIRFLFDTVDDALVCLGVLDE